MQQKPSGRLHSAPDGAQNDLDLQDISTVIQVVAKGQVFSLDQQMKRQAKELSTFAACCLLGATSCISSISLRLCGHALDVFTS